MRHHYEGLQGCCCNKCLDVRLNEVERKPDLAMPYNILKERVAALEKGMLEKSTYRTPGPKELEDRVRTIETRLELGPIAAFKTAKYLNELEEDLRHWRKTCRDLEKRVKELEEKLSKIKWLREPEEAKTQAPDSPKEAKIKASWVTANKLNLKPENSSNYPIGAKLNRPIRLGLYRVYWEEGGTSLAAIGCDSKGNFWVAPTNWISGPTTDLTRIKAFELLLEDR